MRLGQSIIQRGLTELSKMGLLAPLGADVVYSESGSSRKSRVFRTGGVRCLECKQIYRNPGAESLRPRTDSGMALRKTERKEWEAGVV